jgi:hypothetical protein
LETQALEIQVLETQLQKNQQKSGIISQTSSGGSGTNVAIETFGNVATSGKNTQPITGVVKLDRPGRWLATIHNNTDSSVEGYFRFIEMGKGAKELKSTPFLRQIPPKGSYQRDFPVGPTTIDAKLVVIEWKTVKK